MFERKIPYNHNKSITPKFNFNNQPPTANSDATIQAIEEATPHENNTPVTFNAQNAYWANEIRRLLMELTNAIGKVDSIYINGEHYTSLGEAVEQLGRDETTNQLFAKINGLHHGIGVYKNRWDAIYGSAIQNQDGFLPVGMFEVLEYDASSRLAYVESGTALCDGMFGLIFRNTYDNSDFFSYAHQLTIPPAQRTTNVYNGINQSGANIYDWNVEANRTIPASTINKGTVYNIDAYDTANSTDIRGYITARYPSLSGITNMIILEYNGTPDLGIVYRGLSVREDGVDSGYINASILMAVPDTGETLIPTTTDTEGNSYVDLLGGHAHAWLIEPESGGVGITTSASLPRYSVSIIADPDNSEIGRLGCNTQTGDPLVASALPIVIGTNVDSLLVGSEIYYVYQRRVPRIDLIQVGEITSSSGSTIGINIKQGISENEIPSRDFNNVPLWAYQVNEYDEIINPDNGRAFKDHPFYGVGSDFRDVRRVIDTEYTRKIHERDIYLSNSSLSNKDWQVVAKIGEDLNGWPQSMAGAGWIRHRLSVTLQDDIPNAFTQRNDMWRVQFAIAKDTGELVGNTIASPEIIMDHHDAFAIYNVPGNFYHDPAEGSSTELLFPIYDAFAITLPPAYGAFITMLANKITIDVSGEGELPDGNIDPAVSDNYETGIRMCHYDNSTGFTTDFDHASLILIEQADDDMIEYGRFRQIDFSKTLNVYTDSASFTIDSDGTSVAGLGRSFDLNTTTGQITNADGTYGGRDLRNKTLYAFYRVGTRIMRPMMFPTINSGEGQYQELGDFFEIESDHSSALIVARVNNISGTHPDSLPGTADIIRLVLESYRIDGISDIAYGQNQYNEHLYGY